jgi:hypothetical protein
MVHRTHHSQYPTVAIRMRSIVWFAAGLTCAVIAVVGFAATRSSALPGSEETTFVPITPCRLLDTRDESSFTVGPRNTPIGSGETYRQQVTGANGRCLIPSDASGVALNVTAVNPTADSFLTLFPFDATLPQTSNLNYLVGSPPTPNKVDVRLSSDGGLGIYNAFGTVDVIADVAGYYTGAGLQDLLEILATKADADDVYTAAETDAALAGKADADDVYTKTDTDAALAGKADADDVYTKAETDAALAEKANADDVYTKSEIDGRTQMRSISFPIEALRLSDPPAISLESDGVWWDRDDTARANLAIHRPADWTGDSSVTIQIAFERTPSPGNVRFRLAPAAYSNGDDTDLALLALETNTQSASGMNIMREVSASIPAAFVDGDWWQIAIWRLDGAAETYMDPVFVTSVSITYEAHT